MDYIQLNNNPIRSNFKNELFMRFYSLLKHPVDRLIGLHKIDELNAMLSKIEDNKRFLRTLISTMNISVNVKNNDTALIPQGGRVVVVANHPFGGLEGIILATILTTARPDIKILANYLLKAIQPLQDLFIFVDPFEQRQSLTHNIRAMKKAVQWLNSDKMLVIFPAGAVSHFQLRRREISDPPWSTTVARLIRKTEASVLPVYFEGANSYLFQILGLIHPMLRTALLPRELLKKTGKTITLEIRQPIPWEKLRLFADDHDLTGYLRVKTYMTQDADEPRRKAGIRIAFQDKLRQSPATIIPPLNKRGLIREVEALPRHQLLLESRDYAVHYARARQIPLLLQEIGRLREITFRQAYEGTGKSLDLDRFDPYYLHLFLWNRDKGELVGAYRLGQADYIVNHMGLPGLYTSTLFNFKVDFLKLINPALELGRSFVRPEYQKNYSSLLLLWKGIGAWVVQNPCYRHLFGPVSINNRYHIISQSLIATSLRPSAHCLNLSKLLEPKNALLARTKDRNDSRMYNGAPQDINQLSDLIADIENGSQGIPTLLKQYLKLGGQILAYSRDPKFANVLDGLILVDLVRTPGHLLERFLGKKGMESFLGHHQQPRLSEAV